MKRYVDKLKIISKEYMLRQ